jgi:hypothetical protein
MSSTPRTVADDSVPRLPRGVRLVDSPAQGGVVLLARERVLNDVKLLLGSLADKQLLEL